LSEPAVERLRQSELKELVVTNSVDIPGDKRAALQDKLTVLSVANLLGEVIRRIHSGLSVGAMFDE
jgi:ribose-phosphate pyrophosphokinase